MAFLLYSFRVGKVLFCMLYAIFYRVLVVHSRRNHRIFLQSAGHAMSLIQLSVSANLPAQRGLLSFSVCFKGKRGLRMSCCSELLFRCRSLCIWRVTGSALHFHMLPRKHKLTNGLIVDSTVVCVCF